ncbi:MAG: helix-turn-helix domain-containing protein [Planctomycetaceae bacterium]|nr:helix-turn-helix domain-containing protein [Planctomycetaceae bacterium]
MNTQQPALTQEAKRILGAELLAKGYSVTEIMDITGVTECSVYNWKRKIKQGGTDALIVKNHGGGFL